MLGTNSNPQIVGIPEFLTCPITQVMFNDPVVDEFGYTFERAALAEWLMRNNTCPITRARYQLTTIGNLQPNYKIREAIDYYKNRIPKKQQQAIEQRQHETIKNLEEIINRHETNTEQLLEKVAIANELCIQREKTVAELNKALAEKEKSIKELQAQLKAIQQVFLPLKEVVESTKANISQLTVQTESTPQPPPRTTTNTSNTPRFFPTKESSEPNQINRTESSITFNHSPKNATAEVTHAVKTKEFFILIYKYYPENDNRQGIKYKMLIVPASNLNSVPNLYSFKYENDLQIDRILFSATEETFFICFDKIGQKGILRVRHNGKVSEALENTDKYRQIKNQLTGNNRNLIALKRSDAQATLNDRQAVEPKMLPKGHKLVMQLTDSEVLTKLICDNRITIHIAGFPKRECRKEYPIGPSR